MDNIVNTHYSFATDPKNLNRWSCGVVQNIVKLSKRMNVHPIFYGSGLSGITSVIAIAQKMEKHISMNYGYVLIRKNKAANHNNSYYESYFKNTDHGSELWIFVDDFIDEGETFFQNTKFVINIFKNRVTIPFNKEEKLLCLTQHYTRLCKMNGMAADKMLDVINIKNSKKLTIKMSNDN